MLTPQDLFALLSDETRLRCLCLLHKNQELCVCELGHVIGGSQPKMSRHLALLRRAGLVLDERRGQWVYYRLSQNLHKWAQQILTTVLDQLEEAEPYASDLRAINERGCKEQCL